MKKVTKLIPVLMGSLLLVGCAGSAKAPEFNKPSFAPKGEEVTEEAFIEALREKQTTFGPNFYDSMNGNLALNTGFKIDYDYTKVNEKKKGVDTYTQSGSDVTIDATNKRVEFKGYNKKTELDGKEKSVEGENYLIYTDVKNDSTYVAITSTAVVKKYASSVLDTDIYATTGLMCSMEGLATFNVVKDLCKPVGTYEVANVLYQNKFYVNNNVLTLVQSYTQHEGEGETALILTKGEIEYQYSFSNTAIKYNAQKTVQHYTDNAVAEVDSEYAVFSMQKGSYTVNALDYSDYEEVEETVVVFGN